MSEESQVLRTFENVTRIVFVKPFTKKAFFVMVVIAVLVGIGTLILKDGQVNKWIFKNIMLSSVHAGLLLTSIVGFYLAGVFSIIFLLISVLSYVGLIRLPEKVWWMRENLKSVDDEGKDNDAGKSEYTDAVELRIVAGILPCDKYDKQNCVRALNGVAIDIAQQLKSEIRFPMVEAEVGFYDEGDIILKGTIMVGGFKGVQEDGLYKLLRITSLRVINGVLQKDVPMLLSVVDDVDIFKVESNKFPAEGKESVMLQPSIRMVGLVCFPFVVILLFFTVIDFLVSAKHILPSASDLQQLRSRQDDIERIMAAQREYTHDLDAKLEAKTASMESMIRRAAASVDEVNIKVDRVFMNNPRR